MRGAVELRVGSLRLDLLTTLHPSGTVPAPWLFGCLAEESANIGRAVQRVRSEDTNELRLDPRDKLFIVHVGDKAERRKSQSTGRSGLSWESGGPLIQPLQAIERPSPARPAPPHHHPHPFQIVSCTWPAPVLHVLTCLQEALSSYNHTTVELQGGHVPSAVLEWATDNDITLVVAGAQYTYVTADALVESPVAAFICICTAFLTGSRKAKGGKMIVKKAVPGEWGIGSTADAMLQITKLPLLVVQPDAVRSLGRANLRTQSVPDDQARCCHVCRISCASWLMLQPSGCDFIKHCTMAVVHSDSAV